MVLIGRRGIIVEGRWSLIWVGWRRWLIIWREGHIIVLRRRGLWWQ
jgi:hypothetical protein